MCVIGSTPSVCYAWELTESSTCVSFVFLFSLPRCFPRHRPLSGWTHSRAPWPSPDQLRYRTGCLAVPISATPDLGIRTRLPIDNGSRPPSLRTVWPMFNCCSHAKVLKDATSRIRRLLGFLVDLALWVSNTRSAIARLHGSLAVCQTLICSIADTRDHLVREAPLSERLCHVH